MLLTVLIDAIGFGIVLPVLPGIIMRLGHVTLSEAAWIGGWLALIYAAVQFVTGPIAGNLGDRFGRRTVVLASLGGFAIDYALTGFAPTLGWLFLGRGLAGLFGASFGPAGAALADISRPEERARYYGMMGAAFGIGFVMGPAIGGLLGELGPRAPFHAAAGLAAINFVLALFLFPETLPKDRRRAFEWKRANPLGAILSLGRIPSLLPLASVSLFWFFAHMVYPTTWAFYTMLRFGWSAGMVGASLALSGILMALCQMLIVGRVVKRFGERRTAMIGMGGAACAFILYSLSDESWMVWPILVLSAVQSFVMPSISGLMSRRVPADQQGELSGFNGSLGALASILAPLVFNPALAYFTSPAAPVHFPAAAFVIAAGSALVAMLILMATPRVSQA